MKAIINLDNRGNTWVDEYFSDRSLYALPIAGKAFCEFCIDVCSRLGVDSVAIPDYNHDPELDAKLGDGSRWSLKVKYFGSRRIANLEKLLLTFQDFCHDEDVLIFSGPVFVNDAINLLSPELLESCTPCGTSEGDGVFMRRGGAFFRVPLDVTPLTSINGYFEMNLLALDFAGNYTLPGYGIEDGVRTGMNTVIMPECQLRQPVLLGDNVCLERGCRLNGSVIVGDNVIIDKNCELERTVIFSNTFVGSSMELIDKIVDRHRIIDPIGGAFITLHDESMASDTRLWKRHWGAIAIVEQLVALLLIFWLTPWWLLAQIFYLIRRKRGSWYYKLSLDKYLQLFRVITGGKLLLGSSVEGPSGGVFCFSDTFIFKRDRFQCELDDNYCRYHASPFFNTYVVFKSIVSRLFTTDDHHRCRNT